MNKQELRKIYLSRRAQLSKEQVKSGSIKICERLFKNVRFELFSSLHIFLPIENKNEINTWLILDKLQKEFPSIKIIVPCVVLDEIQSFLLTKETTLLKNDWGVPEPVNGVWFDPAAIDCVLMPLLAFDKSGNRIGYGKGFYDRFLKTCRPEVIKVGLSLFEAEEKIDADPFDVPLDFCATPESYYSF